MKNVRIKRAYYSAFFPIRDTPLENKAAVDPVREHRLYQASFLLRDYGFDLEDMPFLQDGNLPFPPIRNWPGRSRTCRKNLWRSTKPNDANSFASPGLDLKVPMQSFRRGVPQIA